MSNSADMTSVIDALTTEMGTVQTQLAAILAANPSDFAALAAAAVVAPNVGPMALSIAKLTQIRDAVAGTEAAGPLAPQGSSAALTLAYFASLLGLPATATQAAVTDAIKSLQTKAQQQQQAPGMSKTAVGAIGFIAGIALGAAGGYYGPKLVK